MISPFFPLNKTILLGLFCGAIFGLRSLPAQEADNPDATPLGTPEPEARGPGTGYIRLLLNQPPEQQVAVTVQTREMQEPEALYEGPGRVFVGGYMEIPVGRCNVVYSVNDRQIASAEINVRNQEFYTLNLLLPMRGNVLPIEKDGPPDPETVTQRFRLYNFSGPDFRPSLKFADQRPMELPQSEPVVLSVPTGTHPLEVIVLKPSTEQFGKIVSEGLFHKGSSLTMILYQDYRGKVGSRMFYDGVLD